MVFSCRIVSLNCRSFVLIMLFNCLCQGLIVVWILFILHWLMWSLVLSGSPMLRLFGKISSVGVGFWWACPWVCWAFCLSSIDVNCSLLWCELFPAVVWTVPCCGVSCSLLWCELFPAVCELLPTEVWAAPCCDVCCFLPRGELLPAMVYTDFCCGVNWFLLWGEMLPAVNPLKLTTGRFFFS